MSMFQDGHELELLRGGTEYFPALVGAIDAAVREVWMETYIFENDAAGAMVAGALARAAARGVQTRLVTDGFGTGELAAPIRRMLESAGVAHATFSPVKGILSMTGRKLRRLHRKLAMVDGHTAFCGGINILDDYWDPNHGALDKPRFDFAVRIRGPIVRQVRDAMERMWLRVDAFALMRDQQFQAALDRVRGAKERLQAWARDEWRRAAPGTPWEQPTRPADDLRQLRAALLLRDNVRNRRRIESAYISAIRAARREIFIANAYFLPGRRLRRALLAAVQRGVRVTLLLQGRYEYFLQFHATRAIHGFLLASGITVYEYRASFLHAKVAVIDGRWSTVGSSNLDPLSLLLAHEANVVVDSARFASELRAALVQAQDEGAERLDPERYARRGLAARLLDWIAYGLFRLGVAVTGRRY
jgi:cardiolipin synthase